MLGDLKHVIHEELLRGVPEHVLRTATSRYVDEIKRHIFRFILANKSNTPADQREALRAADGAMDELEEKVNDLLEDALFTFIQHV